MSRAICVRLPEAVSRWLRIEAARTGETQQDIVEMALRGERERRIRTRRAARCRRDGAR